MGKVVEIKLAEIVDLIKTRNVPGENKFGSILARFSTGDSATVRCGKEPGHYLCSACADTMMEKKDVILRWPRDTQFKRLGLYDEHYLRFHHRSIFLSRAKKRPVDRAVLENEKREWRKDQKFFDLLMRWVKYGGEKPFFSGGMSKTKEESQFRFINPNTGGSYGGHECVAGKNCSARGGCGGDQCEIGHDVSEGDGWV